MAARLTKLQPRLTILKGSRQHWGRRLDKFRVRHGLSVRDLVTVLNGALEKSAIHDLLSGKTSPRLDSVIKPAIAGHVRKFLREKKLGVLQIETEILEIFREPICTDKENQPVLNQRTTMPKPVQNFFGLRIDPFTADPRDHSEVFTTPHLDRIVANLLDSIRYQGFCAVIGDVGAGKSLLKRRIMDQCQRSKGKLTLLWPQFFNMEKVHAGSICSYVLRQFDQTSPRDLVARAEKLKSLLGNLADEERRVALGFDECHRLHPNLLTALKNFWELGSGGFDRYLGLVLFGQPHFEGILRQPNFREIVERLDILRMPPLGKNSTDYITHRIAIAGGKVDKLFEPAAISRLVKLADTPLALGNVANAALLEAFKVNEHRVAAHFIPEKNGDPQIRGMRKAG